MKRAVAAAVLVLALGGCSAEKTVTPAPATTTTAAGPTTVARVQGGPGAKPTACSLISKEEAQAAVQGRLEGGDGAQGTSDTNTICSYRAPDRILLVRLSPQNGERDHGIFPYGQPEPVAGLGDDAKFASGGGETLSALSVLRGSLGLTVLYRGPGDHLAICTDVARTAMAKL